MNLPDRFAKVKALFFDMDGVLTDGGLWLLPDGEWMRRMHIRDGYALQAAVEAGYLVSVVSGSYSEPVAARLKRLGLTQVHMGVPDKRECILAMLSSYAIHPDDSLFMGDDLPDLNAIQTSGIGCCPSDAADEVREAADYVSRFAGGHGCVRDAIERVMRSSGKWTNREGLRSI